MSTNNSSYTQKIIDMWIESKDQLQRKDVIERLIHLYEANEIENEINKDSVDLTEKISSIDDGNKTTKTNHQIICGNILDDNTIKKINTPHCNLVVCSPPYNKNEEYITYKDNLPFNEYLSFLQNFIKQCDKILLPGARFVINIRDITVSSGVRFPILAALYSIFNQLKYTYRGTHIWYKGREESSTGWGSFCASTNPSIIDLFEYVFVFQKDGQYLTGKDNLDKTDFIESVIGLWKIRPVKKIFGKKKINQIKHPCPYPIELAKRVIKLYSHVGDTVLDPFAGVLSTSIAAGQSGRNSIAIDIEDAYLKAGIERFKNELDITEYTESISPVKIEYCNSKN